MPLFNIKVEQINEVSKFSKYTFIFKEIKNNKIEKIKILDPNAWVKKYFSEASEENKFFIVNIKGINDNKLISNPIQIENQEFAEIEINVPIIKEKKNKNL